MASITAAPNKGSPQTEPDTWLQPEHSVRGVEPRGWSEMGAIILTDDELKDLEKRFGQVVRQMGSWNSDGLFGYESVPMLAVERAAEAVGSPGLLLTLTRLN